MKSCLYDIKIQQIYQKFSKPTFSCHSRLDMEFLVLRRQLGSHVDTGLKFASVMKEISNKKLIC